MQAQTGTSPRNAPSLRPLFRHRFVVLLAALLLMLCSSPLWHLLAKAAHPTLATCLAILVFSLMLLSAVFAVAEGPRTTVLALSLAGTSILLQLANLWLDGQGTEIAHHIVSMLFLAYVILVLLRYLFATCRVTVDTISSSLCTYLLLGILWANAYSLLAVLDSGSFHYSYAQPSEQLHFGDQATVLALYYSFVTLTTLGYGDIVPASSTSRMLAAVEAIVGQIYLTVLVARLVGMHIAQSGGRLREETDEE